MPRLHLEGPTRQTFEETHHLALNNHLLGAIDLQYRVVRR
jgi:hypothetical protein